MKKKLVASLAAAMVLGVAGTSFAAANPFVDVPAKHWAYASVTKLAQAGIVDGYGDGTYAGDKMMSRYEMAQIVAKAMARSDKADAAQKAIIDQLSVEFASELEGLNVRVTKLEKNSSTIKVTGEARLRFEDANYNVQSSPETQKNSLALRTRVHLNGQINDQWGYYGRLQAVNNLRGTGNTAVTMDNVYVKGAIGQTTTTVGRFDYVPNNGMILDTTINGAKVDFGNLVKASVVYGQDNNADYFGVTSSYQERLHVAALTLAYDTSKATAINGGYYNFKNNNVDNYFGGDDTAKVWELGFKTKFAANWALSGSYGASDADEDNKAYFAQIAYKGADKTKVGSYGAWVNYRDLEANAAPRPTFDGKWAFGNGGNGGKGYELGFNYTPMLNTVLRVKYVELKASYDGAPSTKSKFAQAQAEFFF